MPGTRRSVLRSATWVALVLTAVALAWVIAFIVVCATSGVPISGPLAFLDRGLTLAVLIACVAALAGAVLGVAAHVRLVPRAIAPAIALMPIAVLGGIVVTLYGVLDVFVNHPFADNPAKDDGSRLSAALRSHGGDELCSDADPGLGPDNTQPWYSAWVEVPTASAGQAAVDRALRSAGFTPEAGHWGSGSDGAATATLNRLGSRHVEIDCSSGFSAWGDRHDAAPGDEILEVQVELPDRDS